MSRSSAKSDPSPPRLLITAGPTHEPIDAVRYVGNRSSGRMGIALADEAVARGWPSTLLLGPTQLTPRSSSHLTLVRFQTAAELLELLRTHWPHSDVLLMAAAVADFRPRQDGDHAPTHTKLRRTDQPMTITLEPTPDLLGSLAECTRDDQSVIGFALEPASELIHSAKEKLTRKTLHAIVANPLETMDAEDVSATLLLRDGRHLVAPPNLPKPEFAAWLLDHLEELHRLALSD